MAGQVLPFPAVVVSRSSEDVFRFLDAGTVIGWIQHQHFFTVHPVERRRCNHLPIPSLTPICQPLRTAFTGRNVGSTSRATTIAFNSS